MLMFAVLARERGRIVSLLLLSVLFLTSWCVQTAHADGVSGTITSGNTVNGTITGQGVDTYTFRVEQGATFVVSLGETGNHDSHFRPQLEVRAPGQTVGPSEARPYYTRRQITNAAAGDWKIIVSRLDSDQSSGGSYALKLADADGWRYGADARPGQERHQRARRVRCLQLQRHAGAEKAADPDKHRRRRASCPRFTLSGREARIWAACIAGKAAQWTWIRATAPTRPWSGKTTTTT